MADNGEGGSGCGGGGGINATVEGVLQEKRG